jgi:hypothetical protein
LKYRTQRYFAESNLYNSLDDDYDDSKLIYIGERLAVFEGKKQKFQLFTIVVDKGDDGKSQYLGISGPYSTNPANLEPLNNKATGGYFEEKLDNTRLMSQLNAYLKSIDTTSDK